MAHSTIIRRIFEYVSDIIGLNSLETRMKVLGPNCYSSKKHTVLAQTIRSTHNSAYFKNVFLTMLTAVWGYKSVSYTMVYTPCFEEAYLDIRNQPGCLPVTSFLKAGLYCILGVLAFQTGACFLLTWYKSNNIDKNKSS